MLRGIAVSNADGSVMVTTVLLPVPRSGVAQVALG